MTELFKKCIVQSQYRNWIVSSLLFVFINYLNYKGIGKFMNWLKSSLMNKFTITCVLGYQEDTYIMH